MAERPNQNIELRSFDSFGPNYSFSISDPMMNGDGTSVFGYYGYTDNKDANMQLFGQSGVYHHHTDKTIEMIAGAKNAPGDVSIVIATLNGDITLTAMKNGIIKIKGQNIMLQADEDIDLKAGRNINIISKNGRAYIDSQAVDVNGFKGNLVEATVGSFTQRVFQDSFIGFDILKEIGAVTGIGQLPVIGPAIDAVSSVIPGL